jgi:hypothetical protein
MTRAKTNGHCETCAWWASNLAVTKGEAECRFRAPTLDPRPNAATGTRTAWPVTGEDDWCGDWTRQEDDA